MGVRGSGGGESVTAVDHSPKIRIIAFHVQNSRK